MFRATTRTARALARRRDDGQGMIEYALVIVLVALVAAVGFGVFGTTIDGYISSISF